jgi:hypothetical protein
MIEIVDNFRPYIELLYPPYRDGIYPQVWQASHGSLSEPQNFRGRP